MASLRGRVVGRRRRILIARSRIWRRSSRRLCWRSCWAPQCQTTSSKTSSNIAAAPTAQTAIRASKTIKRRRIQVRRRDRGSRIRLLGMVDRRPQVHLGLRRSSMEMVRSRHRVSIGLVRSLSLLIAQDLNRPTTTTRDSRLKQTRASSSPPLPLLVIRVAKTRRNGIRRRRIRRRRRVERIRQIVQPAKETASRMRRAAMTMRERELRQRMAKRRIRRRWRSRMRRTRRQRGRCRSLGRKWKLSSTLNWSLRSRPQQLIREYNYY